MWKVLTLMSFVFCLSKIMAIMCVPNTSALSAYLNEFMALIFWLRSWTRMVIEFHTFNTYLWFQQIFKDLQNFIISWDLNICQLWGELQSWCCLHAQTCKKYKKAFTQIEFSNNSSTKYALLARWSFYLNWVAHKCIIKTVSMDTLW